MAGATYQVEWPARPDRAVYANRFHLARAEDGIELQFADVRDEAVYEALRVMLTISGVSVFARWRANFAASAAAYGVDREVSWALKAQLRNVPVVAANGIHMAVDEAGGAVRFGWRSPFDIFSAIEPGGAAVVVQSVVEVRMVAHMLAAVFTDLSGVVDGIEPSDYPFAHPWRR